MKYNMMVGMLIISVLCVRYGMAEFTEKRIKKGPSMAMLKEQCCQEFGEILKQIPEMLRNIALLQEKSIAAINGYWMGDKESFCALASREKLTTCKDRLAMVKSKMFALCQEMDSCISVVNAA